VLLKKINQNEVIKMFLTSDLNEDASALLVPS